MKIQVLSDTHWEMLADNESIPDIEDSGSDVIVLAGDIHLGTQGILWAAKQQKRLNKPIIYVAGNHEFYGNDLYELKKALRVCAQAHNIHYLQNDSVIINGVRFLGSTLWSDFGRGHKGLMETSLREMNDYRHIKAKEWWQTRKGQKLNAYWKKSCPQFTHYEHQFVPKVAYKEHKKAIKWLKKELTKDFQGQTVVVSHHAPSYESLRIMLDIDELVNPIYWQAHIKDHNHINWIASYASDLSELLSTFHSAINLWIHGHIHFRADYALSGVRVVANPKGYSRINEFTHFDPIIQIDLDKGLLPALLPRLQPLFEQWPPILKEAEGLGLYVNHKNKVISELAVFRLEQLAKKFNQVSQDILLPVLSNLNPQTKYLNDNDLFKMHIAGHRHEYTLKKPLCIDDHFFEIELEDFIFLANDYYLKNISDMKRVMQYLPQWIVESYTAATH